MKLLRAAILFTLGVVVERSLSASFSGLEIAIALAAGALVILVAIYARRHVAIAVLLVLALLGIVRGYSHDGVPVGIPWDGIPRNEERVSLDVGLCRLC